MHQYRGGDPQSASSWRDGTGTQYTNWDHALDQPATTPSELVVFVTDGDPTAYDFGEPGDPFPATNVMPGTYVVTEPVARAWRLTNVTCTDPSGDSVVTIADRRASIVVAPGETVTCAFTNAPAGTLPATGSGQLASSLATGVTLVGLGAVLVALRRRGRRAIPG